MGLRELKGRLQHTCIACRGFRELFGNYLNNLLSDPFILVTMKCTISLLV